MPRRNFTDVFASGGARSNPEDRIPGKISIGWVAEQPPNQEENWVQGRQDDMLEHIERNGIPVWDAATAYETNGLALGSDGNLYQAVAPSTNVDPAATVVGAPWVTASWKRLFPPSGPSNPGLIEIATPSEIQALADSALAVTPLGLASLAASTTQRGIAETATNAETQALADATRTVTPAALGALAASTVQRGITRFATAQEAEDASLDSVALTPSLLAAIFGFTQNVNGIAIAVPVGGGLKMVVQAGRIPSPTGNPVTITFPIPFADTEFAVSAITGANVGTNTGTRTVQTVVITLGGSNNQPLDWIAVGTGT